MTYYFENSIVNDLKDLKALFNLFYKLELDLEIIHNWDNNLINLKKITKFQAPLSDICLHAEIKCICYLLDIYKPKKRTFVSEEPETIFFIGCSKIMCRFCECFVLVVEQEYFVIFEFSGVHRKATHGFFPLKTVPT